MKFIMLRLFFSAISALLLVMLSVQPVPASWQEVNPGDTVVLPRDLYFRKDYRIQWWYLTGHLYDQAGKEYGYELTFFGAGVQQRRYRSKFGIDTIYLSHLAVSDIAASRFYHASSADGGAYGIAGARVDELKVWVGKSSLDGSLSLMHIVGRSGAVSLDLSLVPEKPAVLHGNRGYLQKSEASPLDASLYFSFTSLETHGMLTIDGHHLSVHGRSWFDREIASRWLSHAEQGWDWFALQLDDRREIMLYEMRKKDGTIDPFSSGTVIYPNGQSRRLEKKDFSIRTSDHYTSEHTGARYPSGWSIEIPSEKLNITVKPLLRDQEFTDGGMIRSSYWEGSCRIEGSVGGRAYVELTGYGEAIRNAQSQNRTNSP